MAGEAGSGVVSPLPGGGAGFVDPLTADRTAIGNTLDVYRQAYNTLDAVKVSAVWQGLDTPALKRAFSTLASQEMAFDNCEVKIAADQAQALCRGVLNYVPKIGANEPRQRRMSWTIHFHRGGDRWLIDNVAAR